MGVESVLMEQALLGKDGQEEDEEGDGKRSNLQRSWDDVKQQVFDVFAVPTSAAAPSADGAIVVVVVLLRLVILSV